MKKMLFLLVLARFALGAGGDTITFPSTVNTLADGDTFFVARHWAPLRDTMRSVVNGRLGDVNIAATADIDADKLDSTSTLKIRNLRIDTIEAKGAPIVVEDTVDFKDGVSMLYADINKSIIDSVGLGVVPNEKLCIGSHDNSDTIKVYHDNSDGYLKWSDGDLWLSTDEGTNTVSKVHISGKGTEQGQLLIKDEDNAENLVLDISGGIGFIHTAGVAPGDLYLQYLGDDNILMFSSAAEGETRELMIYGYRTGDASRSLQIGVGVDAADQASFDGVSTYDFDGEVSTNSLLVGAGTSIDSAGISGTDSLYISFGGTKYWFAPTSTE